MYQTWPFECFGWLTNVTINAWLIQSRKTDFVQNKSTLSKMFCYCRAEDEPLIRSNDRAKFGQKRNQYLGWKARCICLKLESLNKCKWARKIDFRHYHGIHHNRPFLKQKRRWWQRSRHLKHSFPRIETSFPFILSRNLSNVGEFS